MLLLTGCGRIGYDVLALGTDAAISFDGGDAGTRMDGGDIDAMLTEDGGTDDSGISDAEGGIEDDGGVEDGGGIGDDGGIGDAGDIGGSAVVSLTKLGPTSGLSFTDIDVDWSRRLAYVSSREGGSCVYVIDFSDELAPVTIRQIGSADGTGGVCLGATLSPDALHLFLTSYGAGQVEHWNFGSDPRALVFARSGSLALGGARDVAYDGTGILYITRGGAAPGIDRVRVEADGSLTSDGSYAASPCTGHLNDAAPLFARGVLMSACADDGSPAQVIDATALTLIDSIDMSNGGTSGLWSADSMGDVIFLGGWVSGFFQFVPGTGTVELASRFDNPGTYRDVAFMRQGSTPLLFGAATGGFLEVFDATDPSAPRMVSRTLMENASGEPYGVAADDSSRRAIVVTNQGDFIVIDLDRLDPTTMMWPSY
jgi:hypothetical protein